MKGTLSCIIGKISHTCEQNIEVDLKRDVEQKEYDIGRLERIVQELRDEMTACKLAVATAQSDGDAAGRRAQDLAMQTAPLRQRLTDAEAEVRALRETRATLQREIDMLNEVPKNDCFNIRILAVIPY